MLHRHLNGAVRRLSGRHTTYMLDQNRRYTDDIVYRLRNTVTIIDRPEDVAEPMLKISGQIDEGLERIHHAGHPSIMCKADALLTAAAAEQEKGYHRKPYACPLPTVQPFAKNEQRAHQRHDRTGGINGACHRKRQMLDSEITQHPR